VTTSSSPLLFIQLADTGEAPMNTDPLPSIPNQQGPGHSMKAASADELRWREMILNQEIDSIWHGLAGLVRSQGDGESDSGQDMAAKTQDVFLRLLREQRFDAYVDECWSEEQISRELLSLMQQ
jgi:hypothetical protein